MKATLERTIRITTTSPRRRDSEGPHLETALPRSGRSRANRRGGRHPKPRVSPLLPLASRHRSTFRHVGGRYPHSSRPRTRARPPRALMHPRCGHLQEAGAAGRRIRCTATHHSGRVPRSRTDLRAPHQWSRSTSWRDTTNREGVARTLAQEGHPWHGSSYPRRSRRSS